jgi:hypothetical protein
MMSLPTSDQLQILTLRAIAAYAARCGRRAAVVLRGAVDDEVIEAPLRFVERLASVRELDRADEVLALQASGSVVAVMAGLTGVGKLAALCLTRQSGVSVGVFEAARSSFEGPDARSQAARAARSASKVAVDMVDALEETETPPEDLINAVCRDYQILLTEFGEHENVVLGEPIDLSERWWRRRGA